MTLHNLLALTITTLLLCTETTASPAPTPTHDVRNDFIGRGRIHVLNSTSFTGASLADRIGCLDRHGMLTLKDCAVFTRLDDYRDTLYTVAGNCSFRNPDMPTNRDSYYGRDTHAWSCGGGKGAEDGGVEHYYTIVSSLLAIKLQVGFGGIRG
jgi:hypothetical protein